MFTDVKVTTAGQRSFECHRIVLASMSPFIEAMLQTDMMEKSTGEIRLPFDDDTVESILKYIYKSENIVTQTNVLLVYQAANLLQISSLITLCEDFLRTGLSIENCLGIWKMSNVLGRRDLAEVAKVVVLQNFTELCTVDKFESADLGLEDLKTLLLDPNLNSTLTANCKAVIIWLTLMEEIDRQIIQDLFGFLISECNISITELQRNLHAENHIFSDSLPSDQEAMVWKNTCIEIVQQFSTEELTASSAIVYERTDDAFIVIGGNQMRSTTLMMALNLRDHKWYSLTSPEDPEFYFAICCVGTRLYLSGGSKKGEAFFEFDINENAWSRLPDMPIGRQGHGMSGFSSALYIFGGNTNPESYASHVGMYIPADGSWRKVGEMAKPVQSPSHCVLDKKIFIFGGSFIGKSAPTDCAQVYDTTTNFSWYLEFKLPFKSKALTLSAVAVLDRIYLIYKGSIYFIKEKAEARKLYSLPNGPVSGSGSTSYGDKILIIGGEDERFRTLDTILLFDPSSSQAMPLPWKTPWSLLGFHSTKMKIPSALMHGLREVDLSEASVTGY